MTSHVLVLIANRVHVDRLCHVIPSGFRNTQVCADSSGRTEGVSPPPPLELQLLARMEKSLVITQGSGSIACVLFIKNANLLLLSLRRGFPRQSGDQVYGIFELSSE